MKQIEKSISGVFIIENAVPEIRESPGGYFIEKSRKSELIRLKQKQEEQEKPITFFQIIKNFFKG